MNGEDASRSGSSGVFRDTGPCNRVGLLLAHQENRRLLREWLADDYDVVPLGPVDLDNPDETDVDLVILDTGAYERHADRVKTYAGYDPTRFCPVLLLTDDSPRAPGVWQTVDDVVSIPVAKAELDARVRNLLARRELTDTVAMREAEFRTLFETAPDPALVVDGTGTVERVNAAFADLVGQPADECEGRPLSTFSAFGRRALDAMRDPTTEANENRPTITYHTADDEVRYAECNTSALASTKESDGPRQIIVLRDVTDRIQQAQELSRQVDRLEEFGRVLAHELRNPLSIASGWLQQARETGDPDAFERVETAHERMRTMISELLALARQGNIVGERNTAALDSVVTDAWSTVTTDDATLRAEDDLADVMITADIGRLTEVFTNLFRNAVEHGDPSVTVTVGLVRDAPGVVGIYVADDGPGLTEMAQEHLFEPGFTTSPSGSGFGLAIVKQIVEAHGWEIRAQEAASGGARFEIVGIDGLDTAALNTDES